MVYYESSKFKIQYQFGISMWAPLTPTLSRKSSLKKIIIASPSQEIVHFLTLPNPSAAQDPRSRIHILTPKNRHRSLSKSQLQPAINFALPEKPKSIGLNRDCFIRKKNSQAVWKKTEIKFRSEKLQIKSSEQRIASSLCSSQSSQTTEDHQRLDFTFGANFWNCIKA